MKARDHLLSILKAEGGRLSNPKAKSLLSERIERDLSNDEYEEVREQLIGLGFIEKGKGRGGSIFIPQNDDLRLEEQDCLTTQEKLDELLVAIRRTPGAFAKLNRSTITCLLSSSKDKLYAGYDAETKRYSLSYRVEKGKPDHSITVEDVFKKATADIQDSKPEIQRTKRSTSLSIDDSPPRMNLVMRRLCDLLEAEDLENSLKADRYWGIELGGEAKNSYLNDVAKLISYAAINDIQWPFGSSFRNAFGFDDVDPFITIGRSHNAIRANESQLHREHVVPAVRIKEKAYEMACGYASVEAIAEFLRCHLLIVLLTKEEAQLLDTRVSDGGIKLKTSMPLYWVWGDDPLDRLKDVGITIELYEEYSPRTWKPWKPRKRDYVRHMLRKPFS